MATIGSTVDEFAEEAQATNEKNEVPKPAPATNEDSTVAVPQDARQGHTTKHGGNVPVGNQNVIGRLMTRGFEQLRQLFSRPVPQCSYMDADSNITSYKVIYRSLIERNTNTPYTFKFHDPVHIITGIACVPKDAETSSPEVEVVRGGVGYKEVEIVLTPVEKGKWCCRVLINGIEDESLHEDSTS